MEPFHVNEKWYDDYWYGERPAPKRRSFAKSFGRIAACLFLILGGAAVLVGSASGDRSNDPQSRLHIRLM